MSDRELLNMKWNGNEMNATAATGLSSPLSVWWRWICINPTFQMFLIASNISIRGLFCGS